LSLFLMNNPGLARVWLNEIVLSDKRDQDPLSREWIDGCMGFAKSEKAQPGIDGAVLAMWTLGAMLLWPLWVGAATLDQDEKRAMARRFAREILRGSLYGNLRPGWSPNLEALLARTKADLTEETPKPARSENGAGRPRRGKAAAPEG
ncbi:MAG TPA: hypothetical protein VKS60_13570, partial [Stellaceae bacterium]|nr:hypothetical protein [Stellaceae bacterium]